MVKAETRKRELKEELNRILPILRERYKPDRILLFGSLAEGKVGPWSDIDLVIIKQTRKRFIQRLREVALLTRPEVSVDFLVYTPKEFEEMTSEPNTFQSQEILQRGRVLYDKIRKG